MKTSTCGKSHVTFGSHIDNVSSCIDDLHCNFESIDAQNIEIQVNNPYNVYEN